MPAMTTIMPMPCNLVILSFKKITAIAIVTIDSAEDIGVTSITSPIVNPQLTQATAAASKTPANKSVNFIWELITGHFNK